MKPIDWYNPLSFYRPPETEGVVASIPDIPPVVPLYAGDEYCGMEVEEEDKVSAQDVKRLKAKKFIELIMKDKTPTQAAKELNVHLSTFQTKEEVVLAIKKAIENWTFDPKVRKLYSRAKLMEIATCQDVTDPKGAKVALEAVKIMGQDEEVGWLNPKAPAQAPVASLPDGLMKLLGVGKEDETVEGETDEENDKAA